MGLARVILETLKVEIAAAHLTQTQLSPVSIDHRRSALPLTKVRQ
jgi:hypothetical protein